MYYIHIYIVKYVLYIYYCNMNLYIYTITQYINIVCDVETYIDLCNNLSTLAPRQWFFQGFQGALRNGQAEKEDHYHLSC